MATKSPHPRADGEGSLGIAGAINRRWGGVALHPDAEITDGTNARTIAQIVAHIIATAPHVNHADLTANESVTGDWTFTKAVTIPETPTADTDAASKGYVDQHYELHSLTWVVPGELEVADKQGGIIRIPPSDSGDLWKVLGVTLTVGSAPTGADLIIDIQEDGVSIFTTKPEIDAGATEEDGNEVFDEDSLGGTWLAGDSQITMNIDQIGSGDPGEDITIQLNCKCPIHYA